RPHDRNGFASENVDRRIVQRDCVAIANLNIPGMKKTSLLPLRHGLLLPAHTSRCRHRDIPPTLRTSNGSRHHPRVEVQNAATSDSSTRGWCPWTGVDS